MTIKLPVRITYESDAKGFASYPHFVDADGYHVEFSALAAALNATADAPDLTALREAVEACQERLAEYDKFGDDDISVEADYAHSAVEEAGRRIVNAALALFPKNGTP